ncbi:MAG: hypothetical protein HY294_04010 [Candidatus Rokubacteria bacterium]|nr:hypothetical protein [Candidatus Rokubacteria bacterium]
MAFRVYISHSVSPQELGAIYGVAELAATKGMEPIVSDRRWTPDDPPARIRQLLKGLDAFVVVATASGNQLPWVNAELGEATRAGLLPTAIVTVVDAGIEVPQAKQKVVIDRDRFPETMAKTVGILEGLELEQKHRNLLAGLVVAGIAALLLASRE